MVSLILRSPDLQQREMKLTDMKAALSTSRESSENFVSQSNLKHFLLILTIAAEGAPEQASRLGGGGSPHFVGPQQCRERSASISALHFLCECQNLLAINEYPLKPSFKPRSEKRVLGIQLRPSRQNLKAESNRRQDWNTASRSIVTIDTRY